MAETCKKCGDPACQMPKRAGWESRDVTVCWETDCQQRQIDALLARVAELEARPVPFNRGAIDYARPPVAGPSVAQVMTQLRELRR